MTYNIKLLFNYFFYISAGNLEGGIDLNENSSRFILIYIL